MTNFILLLVSIVFIGTTKGRPEDPIVETTKLDDLPTTVAAILKSGAIDDAVASHILDTPKAVAENKIEEGDGISDEGWEFENTTRVDTRRILYSTTVKKGARPYMVYLQLTKESAKAHKYKGWLCGGVIVHKDYVLTSAACVEDADKFYIVSGTRKYVESSDYKSDDCVCKHRRKVVWKCIPKNYKFDFQDSIKWSSNDIAVVKVDRSFKLGVLERGCEFPTDLICYNNISRELEKPGTKGFIAGWGSGSNFREGVYRRYSASGSGGPENAKCLQEAKVCIMDNEQCAKKWAQRFRNIINQYMICTKDVMKKLSEICDKKYANCTDIERRLLADDQQSASSVDLNSFSVDLGRHLQNPDDYTARRATIKGGFCENDHGGPLIVKYQGKERVIGVISACKIDPKSHSCHGPFLYTSVFVNRQFLSCAITKDVEDNCRRVFRTGITHEEWTVDWSNHREDDDDDDEHMLREGKDTKDGDKKEKEDNRENKKGSEEASDEVKKSAKNKHSKKKESENLENLETASKEYKNAARSGNKKRNAKKRAYRARSDDDDESIDQDKMETFYQSSQEETVNDPKEIL